MSNTAGASADITDVKTALRNNWRLFLIEGIILIVLGSAAILVPAIASLAVAILVGWLFIIGGFVGALAAIAGRRAPGFWWSLISAIVTLVAGCILVFWPIGGTISLTLVLAAFLFADGLLMIFFGLDHRRQLSRRWGWLVANGIIDLLLAGIIFWALPASAFWALGLFIGIDLIFGGWSLITMALAARAPA